MRINKEGFIDLYRNVYKPLLNNIEEQFSSGRPIELDRKDFLDLCYLKDDLEDFIPELKEAQND